MRVILCAVAALSLCGCSFGQAFSRELSRQLADDVGSAVEAKLGDDFRGIGDGVSGAIKALPEAMPKPEKPLSPVEGGVAGLLALIAANAIRGAVRSKGWFGTKREA